MRDTWTVPGDLSKLTSGNGEASPEPEPEPADMAPELPADSGVIDFELDLGDEPASGGIDLSVADEAAEGAAPPAGQEDDGGLVFDLDIGDFDEPSTPAGAAAPTAAEAGIASDAANSMTMLDNVADFAAPLEFELPDLDTATAPTDAVDLNATVVSSDAMVEDMDEEGSPAPDGDRSAPAAKADEPLVDLEKTSFDSSLLDFDFDIDTPSAPETPATIGPAGLDLTSIDLDLENFDDQGVPEIEVVPFEAEATDLGQVQRAGGDAGFDADAPAQAASGGEVDNEEADTKLELARAYEEMGDNEGALELLQEVLGEGSARQKGVAREMIGRLS